jgi:hypothetical protein
MATILSLYNILVRSVHVDLQQDLGMLTGHTLKPLPVML